MIILCYLEWFKTALFKNEKTSFRRLIILKEMKTLKFPNQEEAYEIVDAYAREQLDLPIDLKRLPAATTTIAGTVK